MDRRRRTEDRAVWPGPDPFPGRAQGLLSQWSDRIFAGDVVSWRPPFRSSFVRTELEYVPRHRRQDVVESLLRDYLVPGGCAILCSYGSPHRPEPKAEPAAEMLREWGYEVAGETEAAGTNGVVTTRVAWTDRPSRREQLAKKGVTQNGQGRGLLPISRARILGRGGRDPSPVLVP